MLLTSVGMFVTTSIIYPTINIHSDRARINSYHAFPIHPRWRPSNAVSQMHYDSLQPAMKLMNDLPISGIRRPPLNFSTSQLFSARDKGRHATRPGRVPCPGACVVWGLSTLGASVRRQIPGVFWVEDERPIRDRLWLDGPDSR